MGKPRNDDQTQDQPVTDNPFESLVEAIEEENTADADGDDLGAGDDESSDLDSDFE